MTNIMHQTGLGFLDFALKRVVKNPGIVNLLRPVFKACARSDLRRQQADKLFDNLQPGNKFFRIAERLHSLNDRSRNALLEVNVAIATH